MTESRPSPTPQKPTEVTPTAKPSPKRDATQTFGTPVASSNKKPFSTIKKTSSKLFLILFSSLLFAERMQEY